MGTKKTGYERALKIIEVCKRTKNTILDLGNLGLSEIPEELWQCTWIEKLNLGVYFYMDNNAGWYKSVNNNDNNTISRIPRAIRKLTSLKTLSFYQNPISKIENLSTLINLQELCLIHNQITRIENLEKLSSLQKILLSSNRISKIENLEELKNLELLDLNFNQISKIENLGNLNKLGILDLSSNNISKIENLNLPNLKKLNLSSNNISRIENLNLPYLNKLDLNINNISKIENLDNLKSLNKLFLEQNKICKIQNLKKLSFLTSLTLNHNHISKIENLSKLNQLRILFLNNNELAKIQNLSSLKKLKRLRLNSNKIYNIENFQNLNSLESLNLSNNKISKIENLKSLNSLEQLDIQSNRIIKLENLDSLQKIKMLILSSNRIEKIENLSSLKNLEALFLDSNKIQKLENIENIYNLNLLCLNDNKLRSIKNVSALIIDKKLSIVLKDKFQVKKGEISLKGCQLNNPPIEVVSKGNKAILNYFEEIKKQGINHLYEAKTLIIGKAGAGKTSLRYKLKDQKCQLPEDNESTKGIDIDPITFPLPAKNKDFNVNIWDFGGQEIYHNTHQFFLTKRSLYVLVTDYRTEKHEINYWMQIVEMMGSGSPLLIVQNEKDSRIGDLNLPGLKSQYSEIFKEDFRVDLRAICEGEHHKIESKKAFNQLQTEIQSKLLQLPHIGDVLPKQWVVIRKKIEKLAAKNPHISEEEFYDLCAEHEITDNLKQRDLSQYFHDLGVFLHFQNEDKPSALSEIVILQNTWATEAVYKVLDSTLVKDEQFGKFTYPDLKEIWQDSTWRSKAKELLELMMEFQLCYQIADTAEYIAPQLLPAQQPDYVWDKTNNLQLRYRYGFMPKGIITRFIVKMHKYIAEGQTLVWKEGVILEYQSAKAEIIETYRDNEIHIRVSGSRGKELLTIIAHNIDELNGAFEKIRVDKLVPCNCDECKKLDEPHFYKYQNLIRRKAKGKRTVECEISYEDVNVLKLIEDVLIANFADKEEIKQLIRKPDLKRAIRLLENMIESDSPEANELLIIQSNFKDALDKYHQNILNEADYQQVRARTAAALLAILNEL